MIKLSDIFQMKRSYVNEILSQLDTKHLILLVGPRQSGKTTALRQLQAHLENESFSGAYISLENPLNLKSVNENPENLLHYAGYFTKKKEDRFYLFVDEVQHANAPSNLMKYLYDEYHPDLKIIATGSSSFYIDKKFGDSLIGRKRLIQSSTLNFPEFLHFTENSELLKELNHLANTSKYKSNRRTKILSLLDEYLLFGGYPDVVLADSENEKRIILEDIATDVVKKDLIDSQLTDDLKYFQLMRLIAGQVGEQLNINRLSNQLKLNYRKAENMIYVARKTFMIATLPPFYRNFRKEITKMEKVFFLDSGLRNFLLNDFRKISERQDKGRVLENYFFRLLWEQHNSLNLHYWRTADGYEVDFVVEKNRTSGIAYEVKWNGETPLNRGQVIFSKEYPDFPINKICWENPDEQNLDILRFHGKKHPQ